VHNFNDNYFYGGFRNILRMSSSGMLRCVALVKTDVSEELAHFVFLRSVRRLLVKANVPNSPIIVTLMMEALSSGGNVCSCKSHMA
jgi:hypothetical protein